MGHMIQKNFFESTDEENMYEYSRRETFNVLTNLEFNQLIKKVYGLDEFDLSELDKYYWGGSYVIVPRKDLYAAQQLYNKREYFDLNIDVSGILYYLIEKKKLPEGQYLLICE
jgi:hypothetical protein